MDQTTEARRGLPAMHRLLASPDVRVLLQTHPRAAVMGVLRDGLARLRQAQAPFVPGPFFAGVRNSLEASTQPGLRRVINATGVVLHTNLGRAPLPAAALTAVQEEAAGYCSLELDLESGGRGSRHSACAALLAELTGAEAALVVNNCAAAMLLALSALAAGGEAVVSRGELVEIGGGFRIPDVIRQGGARLVEVGTTNRTRIQDYDTAIGPETRLLLRVHPSNYRITGFTCTPAPAEVAALAHGRGLLAIEDLGGGAIADLSRFGLPRERGFGDAIADGMDLVCASGDKLLGGPQAGLLVGHRAAVERLAHHPLMRALRPDKLTLAALEAVLRLHRDPDRLAETVPVLDMLAAPVSALEARAARLTALLPEGLDAAMVATETPAGGGSLPGFALPGRAVAIGVHSLSAETLAARLRRWRPAVLARLRDGRLLIEMRTLRDDELEEVASALRAAMSA